MSAYPTRLSNGKLSSRFGARERRRERKVIVSRMIVWKMFLLEAVVVEGLGEAGALLRGIEVDEAVAEAAVVRAVDVLQGGNSRVANWKRLTARQSILLSHYIAEPSDI